MKLHYKTNPVDEKELENKSLDELVLEKGEELNVFSTDIPVIITVWIALFTYQYPMGNWIRLFLIVCIVVEGYIIAIRNTTKDNIRKYDRAILKKMEENREEEKKYKEKILEYLKKISE